MSRRDSGFTVALIGPDGAGKTTVARELTRALPSPTRYLYMGVNPDSSNRQLPTTRLVHRLKRMLGAPPDRRGPRDHDEVEQRPRGWKRRSFTEAKAMLRLLNRLAEEWYRQALAWRYVRSGAIVIFDRHYFSDYHAYDIDRSPRSLSRRFHGLILSRLYPQPELLIYLDAPPQVLLQRKGEGTLKSLAQRRSEYRQLSTVVPNFAEIDADRPLEAVVADVVDLVRAHATERATGPRQND